MIQPTPEEILAAKAACRARFGHERVVGIPLGEPIDQYVIMAAMGFREACAYADARADSQAQAASALVVERCLWPDQKTIAAIRVNRGALDDVIEFSYRKLLGWVDAPATAQRFSVATAPAGFADRDSLAAKVAELQGAHPGSELWSMRNRANGFAVVMVAPQEDVYTAIVAAIGEATKSKRGVLTVTYNFVKDLVVWPTPAELTAQLEIKPGMCEDFTNPALEIGGASAAGSATFL